MRWALVLLAILAAHYTAWRITSTLNFSSTLASAVSLITLVAEMQLLATAFLQLGFSWLLPDRSSSSLSGAELDGLSCVGFAPSVDILVPTYGEPLSVVERCLLGCLSIKYSNFQVWLLDDGSRPELKQLCKQIGVSYLERAEHRHAKAGNLNNALQHCKGELVAVFDADVVPLQPFLQRVVPCFQDLSLGFVQTPQSYMNADPVIRNLRLEEWLLPDEEAFYRWIEPSREALGAVICAGTSFVMRRSALDSVGGFETATTSEDLATAIRVTAAGYRNRFVPEKLSAGLAPFTLAAMARQRCRWASGTVRILHTTANPLLIAGLSPLQRLAYLEGILHWLNVLPQLALALTPLSLGVLGVTPIVLSANGVLTHALPFYGAQLLLTRWLSGQSRTALLPELYRWIFMFPISVAVVSTLVGRPWRFRVTPKTLARCRSQGPANKILLPLLLLLAMQVVGLLNLLNPALDVVLSTISSATLTITLMWSAVNLFLIAVVIRCCWDRPGLSECPWFAIRFPALLCSQSLISSTTQVEVRLISETGLELNVSGSEASMMLEAETSDLMILIPSWALLPVKVVVHRGTAFGFCWRDLTDHQSVQLKQFLYQRPALWPVRQAPFELYALLILVGRFLIGTREETWFCRSALPQLLPLPFPSDSKRFS